MEKVDSLCVKARLGLWEKTDIPADNLKSWISAKSLRCEPWPRPSPDTRHTVVVHLARYTVTGKDTKSHDGTAVM